MGFIAWSLAIVAFLTLLWTLTTLPIPIMLLRPRDPKNALIPAAALRACSTFLGLTLSVEGVENIVQNTGCVVLINHQSMLDLIGTLKIKILPIIPTEGCTKDDIPKLMEDTYRVLSENLDALSDSGVKENRYSNRTEKNGH
ncbi:hypothetical protein YQE_09717, partial [Dendroctonus ponderosae]